MTDVFTLSRSCGARAITNGGQRINMPGGIPAQVRIFNAGPGTVCILAGDGTQVAVFPSDSITPNGAGVVIPAMGVEPFSLPAGVTDLHAITALVDTATIYISIGQGG